jgi:predicted metal-dependent phosphoesterase TrpH
MVSAPNGDALSLESIEEAIRILHKNNVGIGAFTDHNNFSVEQYLRASKYAKTGNILLLPGIELDVIRNNNIRGNILLVFDNNLNQKQLLKLEKIIKLKTGK